MLVLAVIDLRRFGLISLGCQLVRPPVLFDFAVSGQRRVDFTSLPEHMLRLDISRDVLDIPGLFNFLKASIVRLRIDRSKCGPRLSKVT